MPTNKDNRELHILIQIWNKVLEANQSALAEKLSELDFERVEFMGGRLFRKL